MIFLVTLTALEPLCFQHIYTYLTEDVTIFPFQITVVDREGHIVPLGKPGELWVRGYNVMLKYWDEEVKTREFIGEDRWARTG